ncbi:Pycsar system effector family protein [Streptomyces klenkii]|uniref:Pycsar system effector family protein n=1 Tax=Streptomyces klenkii TaxID=1420899 RepID=UPI00131A2347|nr:Pycsar system effector family protein [Streptomyces klenkii]
MPDTRAAQGAAPGTPLPRRIEDALADVTGEIGRADAKAAALLGALGVPAAVLAAVVPGRQTTPATAVGLVISALALAAAMALALAALRPRLPSGPPPRGTWLYWAVAEPEAVLADLTGPATDRARAADLGRKAQIARRKHQLLRRAIDTAGIAVAALLAAVGLALL